MTLPIQTRVHKGPGTIPNRILEIIENHENHDFRENKGKPRALPVTRSFKYGLGNVVSGSKTTRTRFYDLN